MAPTLTPEELIARIGAQWPDAVVAADAAAAQPWVRLAPERLLAVAHWLQHAPELLFDYLESLSGVDLGADGMEVVYHLQSILRGHRLVLKVRCGRALAEANPREATGADSAPGPDTHAVVPSVSGIWRAADWHEREAYDLLGIRFEGHADLRRMLLPEDWEGHPLRKDYRPQESYHGIALDYYVDYPAEAPSGDPDRR